MRLAEAGGSRFIGDGQAELACYGTHILLPKSGFEERAADAAFPGGRKARAVSYNIAGVGAVEYRVERFLPHEALQHVVKFQFTEEAAVVWIRSIATIVEFMRLDDVNAEGRFACRGEGCGELASRKAGGTGNAYANVLGAAGADGRCGDDRTVHAAGIGDDDALQRGDHFA